MAKVVAMGTENITFCGKCSSLVKFEESDVITEEYGGKRNSFVLCPYPACGEPCEVEIEEVR